MPLDLRRLLAWLLAAVLFAVALLSLVLVHTAAPSSLIGSTLVGTRSLAGRACFAVMVDKSGSMDSVTEAARDATTQLLNWLQGQVNADDQVAIVVFAGTAAVTLPSTSVEQLPAHPPADVPVGARATIASPAVRALGAAFEGRGCAATGLLMISDGEVGDAPTQLQAALSKAKVTRAGVLNPKGTGRAPQLDHPELAGITVANVHHADDISLAFGELVAQITGQRLEKQ